MPDPNSGRSERRAVHLDALPSEGYAGRAPNFPLPPAEVFREFIVDKLKMRELDEVETATRRRREAELWRWAWKTPQGAAWAREPWRWHSVAMWVRTAALCESPEAGAADKGSLHRFADQIGLTPAGLRENGWKIATDELAAKRVEAEQDEPDDVRSRLVVVASAAR
jgi:hypothetical protein